MQRRIVLVSCDGTSLGRDAALIQHSGYAITAITRMDLFPHTFSGGGREHYSPS
jgi:tRNA/tmRNA/rRNA uracil-C5-methylase (TrmA/RlmC/RlmD family)